MLRSRRTRASFLGVVAVGLLAAGCAEDTSSVKAADAPQGTTPGAVAAAPGRVKGTKVAAGEPIKIGFINSEGGAFSVPELRTGSEVAERYVNTELGGVNGRPIEVIRCATDGSPEKSIDCAHKFVEERVAVVQEGTDLGGDAILPILTDAKIPLVGHVQFGPARMFDKNSYYFGAATLAYGAAALRFYADQGAKSIVWFLPDEPSSHGFTDAILIPTAAKVGITYETVYYDATSPNWAVLAATAMAKNPDVSGSIAGTDAQCAEFVAALRDAGYKGHILAASCAGLHDAIGEKANGVDTDADHYSPSDLASAPPEKQKDLQLYADVMTEAGHPELVRGNAVITFADTMNLVRILSTITGAVDGASASAALMATKDFESFAGPKITCDHTVMTANSACSTGLMFFRIQEDGSMKAQTKGFVDITGLTGLTG